MNKTGPGTAVLSNNNTYAGLTTVSAGTLQLGTGSGMGSVAGNILINPAGTLNVNRSDNSTYASKLSGTGTLLKTGTGTLNMTGSNSFAGNVSVNNGTLNYSGNTTLPAGNYTVTAGTLNAGTLSQSIGAFQITGGTISGSGTLTSNAAYDVQAGTVNAKLAGTSIGLNKTGSGAVVLSGGNLYTGLTTLVSGTLELGAAAQSAVFNLGGADVRGGKLVFDYNGASQPGGDDREPADRQLRRRALGHRPIPRFDRDQRRLDAGLVRQPGNAHSDADAHVCRRLQSRRRSERPGSERLGGRLRDRRGVADGRRQL